MFRRPSVGKSLLTFFLPLVFVWGWAACAVMCEEVSELYENRAIFTIAQNSDDCFADTAFDDCPYTAAAAIIEARQAFAAPILAAGKIGALSHRRFLFVPTSVYTVDRNQNSPPRASSDPPLFLKHCTFRI